MFSRRSLLRGSMTAGVVVLAAACGQAALPTTTTGTPAAGEAPKQAAEAPKQAETSVINFLNVLSGQNEVWQKGWADSMAAFKEEFPQYTVDVVDSDFATLPEKAGAATAGGLKFDNIYGYFGWLGTFIAGNIVQPIDSLLAADAQLKAEDFHDAGKWINQGKNYGIAWSINSREMWYNKNLFTEAGLKTPTELEAEGTWTWEAALDAANKIVKREGEEITIGGLSTAPQVPSVLVYFPWAWGGQFWNPDGSDIGFNTPEFAEALQFQVDTFTRHNVQGGDFFAGALGILHTGHFNIRTIEEKVTPTKLFEPGVAPTPKGPTGLRKAAYAVVALNVGAGAENPEGAWDLIKHTAVGTHQEIWLPQGGGRYPVLKNAEPAATLPYEDVSVYKLHAEMANATPTLVQQTDMDKAWAETWKALLEGATTVPEALQKTQEQVEQWVNDGGVLW